VDSRVVVVVVDALLCSGRVLAVFWPCAGHVLAWSGCVLACSGRILAVYWPKFWRNLTIVVQFVVKCENILDPHAFQLTWCPTKLSLAKSQPAHVTLFQLPLALVIIARLGKFSSLAWPTMTMCNVKCKERCSRATQSKLWLPALVLFCTGTNRPTRFSMHGAHRSLKEALTPDNYNYYE
jgi:hypothetical protein